MATVGINFTEKLEILVLKQPNNDQVSTCKDMEFKMALNVTDMTEDSSSRFAIPDGTIDLSLGMGTVNEGKTFFLFADGELKIKIVNSLGPSQNLTLYPGRPSVFHLKGILDILATNDTGQIVKGKFFVIGD